MATVHTEISTISLNSCLFARGTPLFTPFCGALTIEMATMVPSTLNVSTRLGGIIYPEELRVITPDLRSGLITFFMVGTRVSHLHHNPQTTFSIG